MGHFDSSKDYYSVLGANEDDPRSEIERHYKRRAVEHHPDRGGDEEEMKALNEAYGVLRDETTRSAYDAERQQPFDEDTPPFSSPSAQADDISGHGAEALLCLIAGIFLLVLVRAQWMRFLWPLAILSVFMILAGIVMAHSVMLAIRGTFAQSHPARRYLKTQETVFWSIVCACGYGLYLVLSNL